MSVMFKPPKKTCFLIQNTTTETIALSWQSVNQQREIWFLSHHSSLQSWNSASLCYYSLQLPCSYYSLQLLCHSSCYNPLQLSWCSPFSCHGDVSRATPFSCCAFLTEDTWEGTEWQPFYLTVVPKLPISQPQPYQP